MARELHTVIYDAIIEGKKILCVHYANLETMADPIYDVKHIEKLRQFTGLPVMNHFVTKGFLTLEEAKKKAEENG